MKTDIQLPRGVLWVALLGMLAGCGGATAAPAVSPAAPAELDRAAAGQGVLGSADYARARDVLGRTGNGAESATAARILDDLRATALAEQERSGSMDPADLIRRAREMDRQRAGVQP